MHYKLISQVTHCVMFPAFFSPFQERRTNLEGQTEVQRSDAVPEASAAEAIIEDTTEVEVSVVGVSEGDNELNAVEGSEKEETTTTESTVSALEAIQANEEANVVAEKEIGVPQAVEAKVEEEAAKEEAANVVVQQESISIKPIVEDLQREYEAKCQELEMSWKSKYLSASIFRD